MGGFFCDTLLQILNVSLPVQTEVKILFYPPNIIKSFVKAR